MFLSRLLKPAGFFADFLSQSRCYICRGIGERRISRYRVAPVLPNIEISYYWTVWDSHKLLVRLTNFLLNITGASFSYGELVTCSSVHG